MGHEVSFFAPAYPGHTDLNGNVYRIPSFRPPTMPNYPIANPFSKAAEDVLKNLRLDIIHTHTPFSVGSHGLNWGLKNNIPVVSTNHTFYTEYVHYVRFVPGGLMRWITVYWMRRYYNRCRMIIVPSKTAGKRLEEFGIQTAWQAIPTGLKFDLSEPERKDIRSEYGINRKDRLLVFVGRIAREKNLSMLLDAFQRVASSRDGVRLVIAGDGPYLEELRRRVQSGGLQQRVSLLGQVPRNMLPHLFAQSDLFVFPSETETQGLAAGEASLFGLPCVAVNAGGTPEFVRDGVTGYLTPNDPEIFAGRILELLDDEEKRLQFSRDAKEFASKLTVENMANQVVDVYKRAMENN